MTLHLVVSYQWFDEIFAGRKWIEYRAITPHWQRLIWQRREQLSHVKVSRGYTPNSLTFPLLHVSIGPCPIPGWEGNFYRLHLGQSSPLTDLDEQRPIHHR
ncbi:MAG: hypothetical protein F6K42_05190 [Leptolyngbya sp. SIO1D8]|nr:hypothetical protein [Leptolyngbya sp. SIO1D8]